MKGSRVIQLLFLLLGLTVLAGCGGGGGTKAAPLASKVTISGVISFPASAERVTGAAKLAARVAPDTSITVEAYTLDGALVPSASVHPDYDDATRVYSYKLPNLAPNTDYIIKVKRGTGVLKKLVSKEQAAAGNLQGQTVDAVSTAAVIVASIKLSTSSAKVSLGDALPAGKSAADVSAAIGSAVKPALLESTIHAAIDSASTAVTADTANFANVFNVVVTALVEDKDPAAVFSGGQSLTTAVPVFQVNGTSVTPPSADASTWQVPLKDDLTKIASDSATGYTAPTGSAKIYTDLAAQYLARQDIANASLNYEKALALDPNDKSANFGGAITSGIMLLDDADVQAIVAKWGAVLPTVEQVVQSTSPVKVSFGNLTSMQVSRTLARTASTAPRTATSTENVLAAFKALKAKLPRQSVPTRSMARALVTLPPSPPTVSEMQSVIDNVIMPRLDQILGRLAKVEGTGYSFIVTKAMQGNPLYGSDVVLNDGEFYTLDAALRLFQTGFGIATAYNFDLPTGYSYDTISQDPLAMINSATVFTLKSTGAAKMNAALGYAKSAADKAASAYNVLRNRPAGAGAFDITSWSDQQRTDFVNGLNQVKAALAGPTSIMAGDKSVTIDASKFFTNPLTRADLPTFGYDLPRDATLSAKYGKPVAAENPNPILIYNGTGYTTFASTIPVTCFIVAKSDLPDYALNGILPGNTSANNVAGFNGIVPVVDGKVITHGSDWNWNSSWASSYATDGTNIYTLVTSFGYSATSSTNIRNYIERIDVGTGNASKLADLTMPAGFSLYSGGLAVVNGEFYVLAANFSNTSTTGNYSPNLYHVLKTTGSWTIETTPAVQFNLRQYNYIGAMASNGNELYAVVNTLDFVFRAYRSDFYRVSGLGTVNVSATKLFSDDEEHGPIAVSGNNIYTDSRHFGLVKRGMDGSVLGVYATTSDVGWSVLIGGNFYGVSNDRVVKYAGTPSGSSARLAGLLAKFF